MSLKLDFEIKKIFIKRETERFANNNENRSKGEKILTKENHTRWINSDFNETLYTYRLYKKMNLENIRCDGKTVRKNEIIPYMVKRFSHFYISKIIRDIKKKCFIQKLYNKIISILFISVIFLINNSFKLKKIFIFQKYY